MRLFENEAKQLLENYGVSTPPSGDKADPPLMIKAQIMANNRADMGAVRAVQENAEKQDIVENILSNEFDGREPDEVLIEEQVEIEEEFYLSFMYDTDSRRPTMIFSRAGGTGVEDEEVSKLPLVDTSLFRFREFLKENGVDSDELNSLSMNLKNAAECFLEEDARVLEINPLAKTTEGLVALDAMMELEDDAAFRHDREYSDRDVEGKEKSERELKAEKIDEEDHRGVAGKYTELDGNIAMMLAGGGASLTNMDAMIEYGGEPANYTEYGGNPPTEKVYRLSKVIMSKPGLKGLWHVGGTANNTDILRTMKGFVQALREEEPDYPIVVRRDGPRADEAFELLREIREELDLNMKLYRNDTPMTKTAGNLIEMIEEDEN